MAFVNKLLCLLICFIPQLPLSFSAFVQIGSLDSVPDLERSMYKVIDGSPCVRLLNLSGEIGCANPSREKVVGPVVRYNVAAEMSQSSAVLLSLDDIGSFFTRVARDPDWAKNVGGVLVEADTTKDKLKGFSPDEKFPQSNFSPYANHSYEWNPHGSGIMWNSYEFPVFLLSVNDSLILEEVAAKNEKNERSYSKDVAEFHLVMETTKSGTHDSESCLTAGTCLPLGGYSVWSSLSPTKMSSSDVTKPVILAMASMDSASFFRDKSLGADSSISGLVALLAAVDALSHLNHLKFKKQIVFLVLTGESWGYLGSRKFLHELDLQSDAVEGLNSTLFETVLEIGSVGKGFKGGVNTFFAHSAGGSLLTNQTFKALQLAQDSLKSDHIQISAANPLNPGIPPSSLMSFLEKNSQISGILLEDFDTEFANEFYHSHLDDISNINSSSIVAAASIVARSLYILAKDVKNLNVSDLDAIHANATLVEELLDCLLKCDPGLSCSLVKSYISPSTACPSSYVGVLVTDPSSPPYPGYSSDISRFAWNFLADRTAVQAKNSSSNCQQGCSGEGEVCLRAETDQSACVRSSTRFVPAYSTRLKYEAGLWKLLPPNTSDPMSTADPVWTESNWDVISLLVYTKHDAAYDRLILLAGIGVTGFSYFAIEVIKTIVSKTSKTD